MNRRFLCHALAGFSLAGSSLFSPFATAEENLFPDREDYIEAVASGSPEEYFTVDTNKHSPVLSTTLPGNPEIKARIEEFKELKSGRRAPKNWIIDAVGEENEISSKVFVDLPIGNYQDRLKVSFQVRSADGNCSHINGTITFKTQEATFKHVIDFRDEFDGWEEFKEKLSGARWLSKDIIVELPRGYERSFRLALTCMSEDLAEDSTIEVKSIEIEPTTRRANALLTRTATKKEIEPMLTER